MTEPLLIPCPHCNGLNRIPGDRLGEHPKCGRCKNEVLLARPFDLQQTDFYVQSSGISGQLTATSDHPVAGNQDWQGITAVGHTYRPAGFYISASACQFTIGDRGAIRNLL